MVKQAINRSKFAARKLAYCQKDYSLIKEETQRPKYNRLLEHPFIKGIDQSRSDVAAYVSEVLDAMERNGVSPFTTDQPAQAWIE